MSRTLTAPDGAKKSVGAMIPKLRGFLYSDLYIVGLLALIYIGWVTRCAPFGFAAVIGVSCIALLVSDDILPLTVNIFGAALMIYTDKVADFIYLWPMFIPLVIAIVVFVVRNARNCKFTFGKMFIPQLALSLALLLGGAGVISSADYVRALPIALTLGVGVLAVYMLYNVFLKRDEKRDVALYFAKTLAYIGALVCLQLITCIIRSGLPPAEWNDASWNTGWGNRNNIATYLILTAAMSLYLSTRYRNGWVWLLAACAQYVCLIMTFSRGGILFGAISALVGIVFAVVKAPDRKRQLISLGVVLGGALVFYLALMDPVNDMISSLLKRGTDLSGRDLLYAEAWELFLRYPALGVGLGYVGTGPGAMNDMNVYWFHSTLFQTMATTGVIGMLLYAVYYAQRLRLLFRRIFKKFNLFVLVAWIGFEGYSMMDTGTLVPYPNMMIIIVMTLLLERTADESREGYVDSLNCATARGASRAAAMELDAICPAPYSRMTESQPA